MKCPECGLSRKYTQGMNCSCGYQFFLDPKKDLIADARFLSSINKASSNGTYYFTKNQLIAAYCHRASKINGCGTAVGMVVGAGLATISHLAEGPLWVRILFTVVGLAILIGVPLGQIYSRPNKTIMEKAIRKWLDAGREIPGLILQPTMHSPPPEWPEPDIYDYGVESILIVQHDLLVDLLVKNGFHTAQRCLVISESGYPEYLSERVETLLADRPDLPVYLLHDATQDGIGMARRVRDSGRVRIGSHPLVDMGLFSADVRRLKRLRPVQSSTDDVELPVDMIGYGALAAGLTLSLEQQIPLAAVLDLQQAGGGESTTSFG